MLEPTAFKDDARRVAETIKLVILLTPRENTDVPGTRDLIEDLRDFHGRWNGRVSDARALAIVEQFRQQQVALDRVVESVYLCALRDLTKARRRWFIAENFVKAEASLAEMIKHCPEPLLTKLKAVVRGDSETDRDPVARFREALDEADASEAAYKKVRREFEKNWADRLADPLFQSIDRGDLGAAAPLLEAITEKILASATE